MPEDLGAIDAASAVIPGPTTETAAPEPERKAGRTHRAWRSAKLWGKRAFAVSTTVSTALLAVWILWLVGEATLRKHRLDIESITVPKQLTDAGFSAEVVTRRLRDAIKNVQVQASATTTMAGNRADLHEDISDITIPKAGISAESMAASIRRLLPDSWQHEVSGEFVLSGPELTVRLRLNGEVVFSDASTDLNAVDALIDRAGLKLIESTQPFIAAAQLYATGDLAGATRLADQIIDSLPPDDENVMRAYNLKGMIADDQHDEKNAATFYLRYPDSAYARSNLGVLRYNQGKLEEAISEYRLAIRLDPKNAAAHVNLGNALLDQGKLEEAISEFRLAIQLDPKNASAHYDFGVALGDQGKVAEAISEYRLAIRLAPKFVAAHINLGEALRDQGKFDEAISEYRLAMQINPNIPLMHDGLGLALRAQGKVDEAISEYRLAIQLDPKYASAHNNFGNELRAQGKVDEAIGEYRLAIQLDPKSAMPHNNLGVVLGNKGKVEEGIGEYRLAIQLDPKLALAHDNLGDALHGQGKVDEAISEYRLAIQLDPKSALAHYNLAKILADQVGPETQQDQAIGRLSDACEQILLGARLVPDDPNYPAVAHGIDAKFAGRGHCLLR
jgi:tetratricopeptide (TPR) repeat protein